MEVSNYLVKEVQGKTLFALELAAIEGLPAKFRSPTAVVAV